MTESYNFNKKLNNLRKYLENVKSAVITTHMNPDGDAIGSALALYEYLIFLGVKVNVFVQDYVPDNLKFLPFSDIIKVYNEEEHKNIIKQSNVLFIVDLNDLSRSDVVNSVIQRYNGYIVIIDHHQLKETNPYTDLYLIDTEIIATGQLIYKFLNADKTYKLNEQTATNLYTAIMTDSGSFRYARTNADVHKTIAKLIDAGADPVTIYDEVYNCIPASTMKLFGLALSRAQLELDGQLSIMVITDEMFKSTGTSFADVENFVEKLLSIKNVKAGVLIVELADTDELKISLRSKGNINVRNIATEFGGGGHFNAAGAKFSGLSIDETKRKILELIEL